MLTLPRRLSVPLRRALRLSALTLLAACGGGAGNVPAGSAVPAEQTTPTPPTLQVLALAGIPNPPPPLVDATGSAARFSYPASMTRDAAGKLYVLEPSNQALRLVTPTGVVTTLAKPLAGAAPFQNPAGVAVDATGNAYVSDWYTIYKVTPAGAVSVFAGPAMAEPNPSGYVDGIGSAARFNSIGGLAFDADGQLWAADTSNHRIRTVSAAGLVKTVELDGKLDHPLAVLPADKGDMLVIEAHRVLRIAAGGKLTLVAGGATDGGAVDGIGAQAAFRQISGIARKKDGSLVIADAGPATGIERAPTVLRTISAQGKVDTISALEAGYADGPLASAHFGFAPGGRGDQRLTIDEQDNVFLADTSNHAIRMISANGQVSTLAGRTPSPPFRDGVGEEARFSGINGFAVDPAGNIYVADAANCVIRKVSPGGIATTFAGTAGQCGAADGTGAAARFSALEYNESGLRAMVSDAAGNLYVIDGKTIRKITPQAIVTTVAGTQTVVGTKRDGVGAQAAFVFLRGMAWSTDGALLVLDGTANCARHEGLFAPVTPTSIRKVSLQGSVSTIPSPLQCASDLKVDSLGNMYVNEAGTLRRLGVDGSVTQLGGNLIQGSFSGAGEAWIALDEANNVYWSAASGAIVKIGADGVARVVLSSGRSPSDPPQSVSPLYIGQMGPIAYLGKGRLVASFGDQVVVVTFAN